MIPGIEALACGPLAVPNEIMAHVVQVESSRNPYAIGVVGGRLLRQPRNLDEAVATVRMLEEGGYNYSIGLAQVNRVNFTRFGLQDPKAGFDVCNNLAAGAKILAECFQRNEGRWGDAFSCYYSGNPRTGYEHGYVQRVFAAMSAAQPASTAVPAATRAIPLVPEPAADSRSAPLPAPASQDARSRVLAARISAPDVRRIGAVSRESHDDGGSAPSVSPSTQASSFPNAERGATAQWASSSNSSDAASAAAVAKPPLTPEARLVEAMRREVAALDADPPPASMPIRRAKPEPVAVMPLASSSPTAAHVTTQQSSNSSLPDAARVF